MLTRSLSDCKEILAGDNTLLRELLHPVRNGAAIRYSLAHAKLPRSTASLPHRLKTSEVYYFISGQGRMHVDGETLLEIFQKAGAKLSQGASCAACLGGPSDTFGRLNKSEVCISTTNRNFPGRMGSKTAQVYLASPYTVAASAVTGEITDPREFL